MRDSAEKKARTMHAHEKATRASLRANAISPEARAIGKSSSQLQSCSCASVNRVRLLLLAGGLLHRGFELRLQIGYLRFALAEFASIVLA